MGIRNTSVQRREAGFRSQCAHWLRNDIFTKSALCGATHGCPPHTIFFVGLGPCERPADGSAETIRKQCVKPERSVRVAEDSPYRRHPSRAKDSKTMGFGGVLWVLSAAVGRKYHAVGKTRGAVRGVLRIAGGAVRPRNAMQCNKKTEAPNREPPFLLVTPSYRRAAPPARREPPSRW